MKGYELPALAFAFLFLASSVSAQYWFQFGATGGQAAYQNTGAAASITTAPQPGVIDGSIGFWVGENLANGAFLQAGYVIENQTGSYPSYCTSTGCSNYENLQKGDAEWFYEYFLPGSNSGGFLGKLGPDNSAGINGSVNRYSFYSSGNNWLIMFNGNTIGNVTLGTGSSGNNAPVAFGELANTTNYNINIAPVAFSNVSFYNSEGKGLPLPHGYSYIGYGVGSDKSVPNPYGVEELGSKINYFSAGSGLTQNSNGYELWNLGYHLRIISEYGTGSMDTGYNAYFTPTISEPAYVYTGNGTRAVFMGWQGTGTGSYSGPSNVAQVSMSSNITEYAKWQVQYLVSVNSTYGSTAGSGWYDPGSTAYYSINNSTFYINNTARYAFTAWSNGNTNTTGAFTVSGPESVNSILGKEYYVNAHSKHGNLSGIGWYANGAPATISINDYIINESADSRISFYDWNNGSSVPYLNFHVDKPVNLGAVFMVQYLARLESTDAYGNNVFPSKIYVDNAPTNSVLFLFSGKNYTVNGAYYKGMYIKLNQTISVKNPGMIFISLPLYNVNVTTTDIFGIPVNATAYATFANGTTEYVESGRTGRLSFSDIPYGTLNISAAYSGITESASTSNGNALRLTFVSVYDIVVFAAILVIAFIIYFISRSRK